MNLCFNSTYKRVLFAWLQANASTGNGYYNAGALYHSINEGDTLTSVTKHTSSTGDNFKYMQMKNSTTYTTNINPLASINSKNDIYGISLSNLLNAFALSQA